MALYTGKYRLLVQSFVFDIVCVCVHIFMVHIITSTVQLRQYSETSSALLSCDPQGHSLSVLHILSDLTELNRLS